MSLADIDRKTAIEMLNNSVSRSSAKTKLIERLSKEKKIEKIDLTSKDTPKSKKLKVFVIKLLDNSVETQISEDELIYCLQAIRVLSPDDIEKNSEYLRNLLKT